LVFETDTLFFKWLRFSEKIS